MGELFKGHGLFVPGDPNQSRYATGHYAQAVTINENFIMVEDPGVGDFTVNDPLMYRLYTTPNALRAMAVSQLCTGKETATIPNTSDYNRYEGLIAQYPMIDRFGKQQGLTEDHIRAIKVGVGLADFGHPAFSHLAEQAIQKWGGPENWHDIMWPTIAELGGVAAVLRQANVRLGSDLRVSGYDLPRWAERGNKLDLDVDNLQYIIAEGRRTFETDIADPVLREKINNLLSLDNFAVTEDGRLAAKTPEAGLLVSKLLMLFASQHWNDFLNRAHMHLRIHGMQSSITDRRLPWMGEIDRGVTRNPEGYYMGVDEDYRLAMLSTPGRNNDFIYMVRNTLDASGMEERNRFVDNKLHEFTVFLIDDYAQDFPSQYLKPTRVDFGPKPMTVDIQPTELKEDDIAKLSERKIPALEDGTDNLTYVAGPLKNRIIDPLIVDENGQVVRLSEHDSRIGRAFKELVDQHQALQKLGVKVSFTFNPEYAQEFRDGMARNDQEFQAGALSRESMTNDQLRRVIEHGANTGVELGRASGRLVLKRELTF